MDSTFDSRLADLIHECWREAGLQGHSLRHEASLLLAHTDQPFRAHLTRVYREAFPPTSDDDTTGQQLDDLADLLAGLATSEYGLQRVLYHPPGERNSMIQQAAERAGWDAPQLLQLDQWWRTESGRRPRSSEHA